MTATPRAVELALASAQAASDKLGHDIVVLDVSERLVISDCFVIVSASNDRQVAAVVDGVETAMREHGVKPVLREGERERRWVLLDFGDVVVHVQSDEDRMYYSLERLWKDCPAIPFVDRDLERATAGASSRA